LWFITFCFKSRIQEFSEYTKPFQTAANAVILEFTQKNITFKTECDEPQKSSPGTCHQFTGGFFNFIYKGNEVLNLFDIKIPINEKENEKTIRIELQKIYEIIYKDKFNAIKDKFNEIKEKFNEMDDMNKQIVNNFFLNLQDYDSQHHFCYMEAFSFV
jgi:hypothetical protein